MAPKTRKRSRATVEDERADCPFELRVSSFPVARTGKDGKPLRTKIKLKKKNENSTANRETKLLFQPSLFEPTGKFPFNATMDAYYHIEPHKDWTGMTRYHSFVLNSEKYQSCEFVFVANANGIARGKLGEDLNAQVGPCNVWVAQILEIRALDERHVFARVCWMYSPDELPTGRRAHHGKNELIASNHLDIINVLCIVRHAEVSQWIEADDGEILDALYWRQAFDYRTSQLSTTDLICRCQTPANPDQTLVGCTSSDCGKWMHIDCLREDVLNRVHDQLCADQPHVAATKMHGTGAKLGTERQSAQAPPTEVAIADEQSAEITSRHAETNIDNPINHREESSSRPAKRSSPTTSQLVRRAGSVSTKNTGHQRKSDARLHLESLHATLRMRDGPMVWEIKNSRPDVDGDAQTWSETVYCLLCSAKIE